jgi:hypothetical protein
MRGFQVENRNPGKSRNFVDLCGNDRSRENLWISKIMIFHEFPVFPATLGKCRIHPPSSVRV